MACVSFGVLFRDLSVSLCVCLCVCARVVRYCLTYQPCLGSMVCWLMIREAEAQRVMEELRDLQRNARTPVNIELKVRTRSRHSAL